MKSDQQNLIRYESKVFSSLLSQSKPKWNRLTKSYPDLQSQTAASMSSNTHSQDKSNDSGQHAEEAQPTENAAETNGPDEVNEPQSGETANGP